MSFNIGDVCIVIGSTPGREHFIGREVTVIGPATLISVYSGTGEITPPILRQQVDAPWLATEKKFGTSTGWAFSVSNMRLKRPPDTYTDQFTSCDADWLADFQRSLKVKV